MRTWVGFVRAVALLRVRVGVRVRVRVRVRVDMARLGEVLVWLNPTTTLSRACIFLISVNDELLQPLQPFSPTYPY